MFMPRQLLVHYLIGTVCDKYAWSTIISEHEKFVKLPSKDVISVIHLCFELIVLFILQSYLF